MFQNVLKSRKNRFLAVVSSDLYAKRPLYLGSEIPQNFSRRPTGGEGSLYPCNKPLGWYVRLYRRPFVPIASCCLTVGIIIAVVVINGGNRAQSATMISHDKHTKHVPFDETGEARPERPSRPFAISIRRPYHSGKRGEAPRKRLSRPFVIGIRSLYHSMKCNVEPWAALPYSKNNREIVNMARRQARKFWGLRPLKRL